MRSGAIGPHHRPEGREARGRVPVRRWAAAWAWVARRVPVQDLVRAPLVPAVREWEAVAARVAAAPEEVLLAVHVPAADPVLAVVAVHAAAVPDADK